MAIQKLLESSCPMRQYYNAEFQCVQNQGFFLEVVIPLMMNRKLYTIINLFLQVIVLQMLLCWVNIQPLLSPCKCPVRTQINCSTFPRGHGNDFTNLIGSLRGPAYLISAHGHGDAYVRFCPFVCSIEKLFVSQKYPEQFVFVLGERGRILDF